MSCIFQGEKTVKIVCVSGRFLIGSLFKILKCPDLDTDLKNCMPTFCGEILLLKYFLQKLCMTQKVNETKDVYNSH
jgi:hypothetical protein